MCDMGLTLAGGEKPEDLTSLGGGGWAELASVYSGCQKTWAGLDVPRTHSFSRHKKLQRRKQRV
mgnify:CR=1 FL=1